MSGRFDRLRTGVARSTFDFCSPTLRVNMNTAQQLNAQFGIDGKLSFRDDASGLVIAEISNPQATASLCLQGAHLLTWQPRSQTVPVLWLSRDAKPAAGKSIRGGVPEIGRA